MCGRARRPPVQAAAVQQRASLGGSSLLPGSGWPGDPFHAPLPSASLRCCHHALSGAQCWCCPRSSLGASAEGTRMLEGGSMASGEQQTLSLPHPRRLRPARPRKTPGNVRARSTRALQGRPARPLPGPLRAARPSTVVPLGIHARVRKPAPPCRLAARRVVPALAWPAPMLLHRTRRARGVEHRALPWSGRRADRCGRSHWGIQDEGTAGDGGSSGGTGLWAKPEGSWPGRS